MITNGVNYYFVFVAASDLIHPTIRAPGIVIVLYNMAHLICLNFNFFIKIEIYYYYYSDINIIWVICLQLK